MWEAMWMLASFQSTNDPFIQILPVPGKAMCPAPWHDLIRPARKRPMSALQFAAKRTFRRPCLERLPAVPAEAGVRGVASAKTRLNLGDVRLTLRGDGDRTPRDRRAGEQIRQQVRR